MKTLLLVLCTWTAPLLARDPPFYNGNFYPLESLSATQMQALHRQENGFMEAKEAEDLAGILQCAFWPSSRAFGYAVISEKIIAGYPINGPVANIQKLREALNLCDEGIHILNDAKMFHAPSVHYMANPSAFADELEYRRKARIRLETARGKLRHVLGMK